MKVDIDIFRPSENPLNALAFISSSSSLSHSLSLLFLSVSPLSLSLSLSLFLSLLPMSRSNTLTNSVSPSISRVSTFQLFHLQDELVSIFFE